MKLSAPTFQTDTAVAGGVPDSSPVQSDGSEVFDLDANMAEFFGHRLDDTPAEPVVEPNPSPALNVNPQPAAEPTPAQPGTGEASPAQPTPNAEPAASPAGGGEPEVDPGLLAAIMLGTEPPKPAAATEAAPAAPAPPQGPTDDDAAYMPIVAAEVKIPSAVLQSIFNSEDPVQQEQALVQLLAGWGNALTAMMDKRVKEHYVPRVQEQFQQRQAAEMQAQKTHQDFYSNYPDLASVPQIVTRVAEVVAKQNPTATYEQVRKLIGDTSRAMAKKMGVQLTGTPAPAPAPAQPVIFGGARPATHGLPAAYDPTDPGNMVDELANAGFG